MALPDTIRFRNFSYQQTGEQGDASICNLLENADGLDLFSIQGGEQQDASLLNTVYAQDSEGQLIEYSLFDPELDGAVRRETGALLQEMATWPLLSNLGKFEGEGHIGVASLEEAMEKAAGSTWGDISTLLAHLGYTVDPDELRAQGRDWTEVSKIIGKRVRQIVTEADMDLGLDEMVEHWMKSNLQADLIGICIETEFSDVTAFNVQRSMFVPVYRSGHIICGWDGCSADDFANDVEDGIPPEGKFFVY